MYYMYNVHVYKDVNIQAHTQFYYYNNRHNYMYIIIYTIITHVHLIVDIMTYSAASDVGDLCT